MKFHKMFQIIKQVSFFNCIFLIYFNFFFFSLEIRKEEGNEECFICYQPIQFCALGQCNHRGVCSYCAVRSRKLFKENKCSICKVCLFFF